MKRLNEKLLDSIGVIIYQLLESAILDEEDSKTRSETFRLLYRGSAKGKREFVKNVTQILRENDVIDIDDELILDTPLSAADVHEKWKVTKEKILGRARRLDPS